MKQSEIRLAVLIPCALLTVCASIRADAEIKVSAQDSTIPNLIVVTLPSPASCATVSDTLNLLAVGQKDGKEPHVLLYALDAQGQPTAAAPSPITLPRPAALAKDLNYPLSLAFHPRLPLLYVWQDVEVPHVYGVPNDPAPCANVDHLLIYDVAKSPPALVRRPMSAARRHLERMASPTSLPARALSSWRRT